jgi:dihydrodipicolinate reductase
MVCVAVAGGSGDVGKTIVETLKQNPQHQVAVPLVEVDSYQVMASHTRVSQRGGKDLELCDYGEGVTSQLKQDA